MSFTEDMRRDVDLVVETATAREAFRVQLLTALGLAATELDFGEADCG